MIPHNFLAISIITASLVFSTACLAKPSFKGHQAQTNVNSNASTQHHHTKTSKPQRYLKPGAGISYEHNLPKNIDPGQTVVFQLTLDESYATGNMTVDIRGQGDIRVFPSSTYRQFDMSSGREHVMDVSVTVGSAGRHYLNITAMANQGYGQAIPRVFSIPVKSGTVPAMKPHNKMITTASGENIIVMQAEEVIIQE